MNRLAIVRGEGAQGVLHLHPELTENIVWDVSRQLGAEKNADPFGADQFDHGLDFIEERLFGIGKNQVRFVDKENELWLIHVAHFRESGIELGEQLEHEGGEKFRAILHVAETENRDRAKAVDHAQQILNFKRRLAEELLRALLLELDQFAKDERSRCRRDEPIFRGHVRLGLAGDVFEDFLEIFQIEQRQMLVVAEFVDQRDEARLRFVEPKHPGKKERPEFQDSRPKSRAGFVREGQEFDRISARRPFGSDLGVALGQAGRWCAGDGEAAQVALDIHEQGRHSGFGELLRDHLQRLGFSRAGRAGDQAVTIHRAQRQPDRRFGEYFSVADGGAEENRIALERISVLDRRNKIPGAHATRIGFALEPCKFARARLVERHRSRNEWPLLLRIDTLFSTDNIVIARKGTILMKTMLLILALATFLPGLPLSPAFAQWSSDPMANLGVAVKPSDQVQPKVRPTARRGLLYQLVRQRSERESSLRL